MRRALFVLLPIALITACSSSDSSTSSSSSGSSGTSADKVTQTIGPDGGSIVVGGGTVTFPKGALTAPLSITITNAGASQPPGFVALSPVFKCEPSGTDFVLPVTMQMPFTDDGKGPFTMWWSTGADPTFKDVGGTVQGKTVVATVMHFSSGFVGRKLN